MNMVSVEISIPHDMAVLMENQSDRMTFERNAMMIYPYIHSLQISHGRAAEILGVSKLDLIEFYNSMGLSYLDQSEEELEEELQIFRVLKGANKQ